MPLQSHLIAVDARFWAEAAHALCDFAAVLGLPARQLQPITWLVPTATHAGLARSGLRESIDGAFIAPRIVPLAAWLDGPLRSGVAIRAEMFAALRGSAWVREAFGAQPSALWALARGVAQLCDELTLVAIDQPQAFGERLQASLARHFHRRAARALQPQSQLVLQLWRARRADDPLLRLLQALDARADCADTPLVVVGAGVFDAGGDGWLRRAVQRYAQRAPVLQLEPDIAATVGKRPMLAAAWPELAGAATDTPIAARADAIGAPEPALQIVAADSLEDEASAVARQVLDWRQSGVASIALVALDRLTARRARALLERAQVIVRDETGWKLSTTSAAAAVMRWFDLVADNLYWRDLLDWLKSPFTLSARTGKAREVAFIERAIRASGTLQGAAAIRRALESAQDEESATDAAGARALLALIETQAQATRRAGPTLAAHLRALDAALDALGLRPALAGDPVGAAVLRELEMLAGELAGVAGHVSLAELRALLAERFEEVAFVDRQVDSPVMMLSLATAALRPFDAALLIGADARHLPTVPAQLLFMSNAVRAELGLATTETAVCAQATQLAALLATVPQVVATWRPHIGDEPNSLSPLLARLQFVARRAGIGDLARQPPPMQFDVAGVDCTRPAPAAPALLPPRISASQYQSLVDCAYQFYARRLLNLAELEDVIEMPDKRDFGEALHAILRRFHRRWGDADFSGIDAARLEQDLAAEAQAVFEPLIARAPAFLAFARRFDRLVRGYVQWLQAHAARGWRFEAAEQDMRQPLALRDDHAVELSGRFDRIDRNADGRLRVLDYKARAADVLRRGLKAAGEDVQLPFYGLLLARRADSAAYVSFDRASEDDGGVATVEPPQSFAELVDAVAVRLQADFQRIADGAPLPAIGVRSVCDRCEMRGLCRRDYWEAADSASTGQGGDGAG